MALLLPSVRRWLASDHAHFVPIVQRLVADRNDVAGVQPGDNDLVWALVRAQPNGAPLDPAISDHENDGLSVVTGLHRLVGHTHAALGRPGLPGGGLRAEEGDPRAHVG